MPKKTSTAAVIYHKADFDGICSYAITRQALESEGVQVTPMPWNHGEDVPETDGFDEIFVLDCCMPAYLMLYLNQSGRLVWIDHHITAINESHTEGFDDARGRRETGRAACELCWLYFHDDEEIPTAMRLLSAYDTYNKDAFAWNQLTLPFQFGMRNRYDLDAEAFRQDFADGRLLFTGPTTGTDAILAEGKAIIKYLRQNGERAARNNGMEILLAGQLKALCLITTTCFSLPYEKTAQEMGCEAIVCLNRTSDGNFKLSAYSAKGDCRVNLGQYMHEKYHGGGHRNAAGAVISEKQFINFLQKGTL